MLAGWAEVTTAEAATEETGAAMEGTETAMAVAWTQATTAEVAVEDAGVVTAQIQLSVLGVAWAKATTTAAETVVAAWEETWLEAARAAAGTAEVLLEAVVAVALSMVAV